MTDKQKKWIDGATYQQLLNKWRHAPAGDPIFQGDTGDYFRKVMKEKRQQISDEEHIRTSKEIGW